MFQESLLTPRPPWLAEAFAAIGRHRFLTPRQCAALVEQPMDGTAAVLAALVRERLLVELRPTQMLVGSNAEAAFALTRRGASLLAEVTGREAPVVPHARRSLYTLAHEVAVNDVAVVLDRLHALRRIRVHRWETNRERIASSAIVSHRGRIERIPLVADGLAIVEADGRTGALIFEIDRGTVSLKRMRAKFSGYEAWWRADGGARRFGMRNVRVLTLAPTRARLASLRSSCIAAVRDRGSGLFWFAEQMVADATNPDRFLGDEWLVGRNGDDRRRALLAPTPYVADGTQTEAQTTRAN